MLTSKLPGFLGVMITPSYNISGSVTTPGTISDVIKLGAPGSCQEGVDVPRVDIPEWDFDTLKSDNTSFLKWRSFKFLSVSYLWYRVHLY